MRSRRKWVVLLIACAVLAIAAFALFRREPEPYYDGKPLSEWVLAYGVSFTPGFPPLPPQDGLKAAAHALNKIGPNAIPYLLHWMEWVDSHPAPSTWIQVVRNAWVAGWLEEAYPWKDRNFALACGAPAAFGCLGPGAAAAVPELARRVNLSSPSGELAVDALGCMQQLGFAPLMEALTNGTPVGRERALGRMSWLETNALPAVPFFLQKMRDPDRGVAFYARCVLRAAQADPQLVIPVLVGELQDPNPTRRLRAAYALSEYGRAARAAVPLLMKTLDDPDANVRMATTNALRSIAPEMFTNDPPRKRGRRLSR